MPENIPEHKTVEQGGYRVTFHPAFASRCALRTRDGETELYRQTETYRLPPGQAKPPTRHQIRLQGGAHGRDIAFTVDDPKHQVARIVVELHPEGYVAGSGQADASDETITIENRSITCPPSC